MISFKALIIWYAIGFFSRAIMIYREEKSFSVDDLFDTVASGYLGPVGTVAWIHEELTNTKSGRNFLNKKLF